MKKIIFLFIIIINLFPLILYGTDTNIIKSQEQSLGISDFINSSKEYTNGIFDDIDLTEIFNDAITGKIEKKTLFNKIINNYTGEIKNAITNMATILIIIVIHSILVAISENLGNKSVSQIAYFVEYIIIVTLVLKNFSSCIVLIKNSVTNLVGFINSLIPILITLMMTTGSIVSAGTIKPIILILINFIGNFINNFILPITIIGTTLGIMSKISNKAKIDKLAKFLKSTAIWILGTIMTLFVTVLSLEGTITQTVDGVTAKTTKAAISSLIPVVGKILGDATDAIIGGAGIIKNAVGIVGIVIVLGICLEPIIKLSILSLTYNLASAICQPIADEKVIGLLEIIGDSFKVLLGIMFCLVVMIIIGLTIVIKLSNGTLLYR